MREVTGREKKRRSSNEGDRVVGGFDMALEKAVVLDSEGESGSGGAVGGEVDGGDGLLAVADEEA